MRTLKGMGFVLMLLAQVVPGVANAQRYPGLDAGTDVDRGCETRCERRERDCKEQRRRGIADMVGDAADCFAIQQDCMREEQANIRPGRIYNPGRCMLLSSQCQRQRDGRAKGNDLDADEYCDSQKDRCLSNCF